MENIDLRSDTVTWPTDEMRDAMARAKVGDDVWGDDPTVIRLQDMAAERVGMERTHLYRKLRALGVDFRQGGYDD